MFGELTQSFDKMGDGDGPATGGGDTAAVLRATATAKKRELELTFRYFGIDYVNPMARPIAASDEFEGQRARDEVGGRVRYVGTHGEVALRTAVDIWVNPSTDTPKGSAYVRADVTATDRIPRSRQASATSIAYSRKITGSL